eukprot:CAMPEP_0198288462 /NCGR_PEP_ID=MMETSP1449-20131203/6947_1 /TAXON_ID=420275 /ORGANISM="Attheya septentrionalis, Strain CCMP2084" /LENGTH=34 /DNA_ID= /DNA_START= /DNA_END= /DNA_ORIENTATION=
MSTATLIGFGSRAPTEVLELLSKAVNECGIKTIA